MPANPPSVSSLTVLGGPLKGHRLVVDEASDEILVGSDPDCTFCLDAPSVSPIHARIWLELDGVTVFDTRSPHGIFVNDDKVAGQAPLRDGDILWLGAPGEAESVMIQCRLVAPAPLEVSADEFFFDEGSAPGNPSADTVVADEFVSEPEADDAVQVAPDMEVEDVTVEEVQPIVDEVEPVVEEVEPVVEEVAEELLEPDEPMAVADDNAFFVESPAPAEGGEPATQADAPDEMFFVDSAQAAASPSPPSVLPTTMDTWPAAVSSEETSPASSTEEPALFVEEPGWPELPSEPAPEEPVIIADDAGIAFDHETLAVAEAGPASAAAVPVPPTSQLGKTAPAPTLDDAAASGPVPPAAAGPPLPKPRPASEAARPRPEPMAGGSPRPTARMSKTNRRLPLLAAAAVLALLALGAGAYAVMHRLRAPEVKAVSPERVAVGGALTLTGSEFAPVPGGNVVLFGDKPGTVREASSTRLTVEVPELPTASGKDASYHVLVRVGERESAPASVAVYRAPRIHGLSPDVAMPGEEVSLAGTGWSQGVTVRFGSLPAEVLAVDPASIRVRVPAIDGQPGTSAPVVVAMGADASNPAPFMVGRLPLIKDIEPRAGAPGDVITLSGRGFHWKDSENNLRIGGVRALVLSVTASELKAVVPWVSGAGDLPVELRVPGTPNAGEGTFSVTATDVIDFRFAAEPLDDAPGHDHVALATPLGPAFVLAASGGRTAAERALEAQKRLNDAAVPLKATRDLTFEARNLNASPVIGVAGRPEPILEVSEEDASAYAEDWTKLGARKGPVTAVRLALWWEAVARDLVLLLIRSERPHFAAALAPEGRVMGDVFDAARRTGRFGVPREISLKPATMAAVRVMGLRVPAQIAGPGAAGSQAAAGGPPLRLEGDWTGSEVVDASRKYVSVRFKGRGGSLAYEGGISISVPLEGLDQPQRGAVRFSVPYRGGSRYYIGKWNGEKISGAVSSDANGRAPVGSFELSPR